MPKTKSKPKSNVARLPKPAVGAPLVDAPDRHDWIAAPKVRARLGNVSAVTFWRWRHDPELRFPAGKIIRGRWYFPWGPVAEWWAQRPQRRATGL
jgi:hypothetical protein